MQSIQQYRSVRETVAAQAKVGKIVNWSIEERIVLKDESLSEGESTTTSLDEKSEDQDPITVGWDGPQDALNPRNWSRVRRAWIFGILWINV